ncbi:unnamed protein product (macronuclear) [Paramecium tetraurelia]|uniref:Transmembrane protein n=1 Tax=Paramecium tetraurelia TaxID=5888 RepID=A0BIS9_PARTE|nr:uncharacterized protein GSPATT00004818001 [Paramecium tetraurelia]CAK58446.1 unnamed protein product [Paramecium tetraurelia]|eukprot:XP_001425844.1 hypothetical protein (macronuclear) [Paramecium tetraurelia strain d4-2]
MLNLQKGYKIKILKIIQLIIILNMTFLYCYQIKQLKELYVIRDKKQKQTIKEEQMMKSNDQKIQLDEIIKDFQIIKFEYKLKTKNKNLPSTQIYRIKIVLFQTTMKLNSKSHIKSQTYKVGLLDFLSKQLNHNHQQLNHIFKNNQ